MKHKISLVLIFLMLTGLAGAFAKGRQEGQEYPYGPRWGGPGNFAGEKSEITGELYFRNKIHPELKSGGEEYELLVPHRYYYGIDLQEGQTITVEGYQVEGMYCMGDEEEDETHIWVTKAVIDGKEYDLSEYGYGGMGGHMMGWGHGPGGMMGWGRGPGGRGR